MIDNQGLKFVATIEARMTSSRLPGKVLMPVLGRPILHYMVERLRQVPSLDAIVLATTVNQTDDVLADFARERGIGLFRGSEDDVMGRVIAAGESVHADVIVEVTGDCPIIDPGIVEQTIRMFKAHQPHAAYVSNNHVRSYPIGMDTRVFRLDTLKRSAAMTDRALDHEHVSLHMEDHPELFSQVHLVAPPELHWPDLGLTLDEPRDFELLSRVIEHFGDAQPLFTCQDVVRLLRARPEWVAINDAVRRKGAS